MNTPTPPVAYQSGHYVIFMMSQAIVEDVWPRVKDKISKAISNSHDEVSIETVKNMIAIGKAHLWILMDSDKSIKSVFVTEIMTTESGSWCNIIFSWSDNCLKYMNAMFNTVKEHCARCGLNGIKTITSDNRMIHYAHRKGFSTRFIEVVMSLDDEKEG